VVAVSIINYNSIELLKPLLKNLLGQIGVEVWVVDNDSPDKGAEVIKKDFGKVHLIESKENGGFAKGQNLALKKISTDYALILNPDTKIPDDAISKMVEFMDAHPKCGVSSCKIIGFDGKLHSNGGDFPIRGALFSWLFNLESLPGAENVLGNFHQTGLDYYSKVKSVDWVGGTIMFVRTEVFKKIGFLPEDYFMYFEDTDFCYQVKKGGFEIMINPEVTIKHASGASSDNPRLAQFKGEMKGLEIFYRKEFGTLAALFVKMLIYLAVFLRMIAFYLVGKPKVAQTYGKVLATI
jgi:GT2 family glycosyltransferase